MSKPDLEFSIAKLRLAPGDVLVIKTAKVLSMDHVNGIGEHLRRTLPADTKVMILDAGMELAVLSRAEVESRAK